MDGQGDGWTVKAMVDLESEPTSDPQMDKHGFQYVFSGDDLFGGLYGRTRTSN